VFVFFAILLIFQLCLRYISSKAMFSLSLLK
jgi:hypothetical protein